MSSQLSLLLIRKLSYLVLRWKLSPTPCILLWTLHLALFDLHELCNKLHFLRWTISGTRFAQHQLQLYLPLRPVWHSSYMYQLQRNNPILRILRQFLILSEMWPVSCIQLGVEHLRMPIWNESPAEASYLQCEWCQHDSQQALVHKWSNFGEL